MRQLRGSPQHCPPCSPSLPRQPAHMLRGRETTPCIAKPSTPRYAPPLSMAAASTSSPPSPADAPPPYARLSTPVYSLATTAPDGSRATMNLVTYASPVSLSPRHFALGLFVGTLSWENALASRRGVLQILGESHAPLFQLLGQTSGRDVDKLAELAARGHALEERGGVPTLAACAGAMELEIVSEPLRSGDHDVVIAAVGAHWRGDAAATPLYTGHLRELGLM